MSAFLNSQIGIFLIYFIAGLVICLLYDVFRALRKTVKTTDLMTGIEDVIFWILVAVFLIYLIFIISSGEIRFFMFAAICIGGITYYFTISKYFMNISVHILELLKKIIKKIISIILIPLRLFLKINKKVKCIICINLKNISKNLNKKPKKQVKKRKNNKINGAFIKNNKLYQMFFKTKKNKKVEN